MAPLAVTALRRLALSRAVASTVAPVVSCAPTLSRASLHLSAVQLAPKAAASAGKPAAARKPRAKKAAGAGTAAKPRKAKAATKGAATGAKKSKSTKKATKTGAAKAKPKKKVLISPRRPEHRPPTRPGTAYTLFVKEQAARVIPKGTPTADSNAQITALASQWSTMGPAERAPYEQQHESERRKYEAAKAKYFETVTPEELAAENAWRRATNKRRAAKPTQRPRAHLKLLSKPSATKRPLTPFFVFAAAERERLASAGEGVKSVPLFAKEMGQRWRAMSESEKAAFKR